MCHRRVMSSLRRFAILTAGHSSWFYFLFETPFGEVLLRNTAEATKGSNARIARLDTIRLLAAVWVAISHGAMPLKPLADTGPLRLIAAVAQDSFSGVAAVIVFFIVSGLCIHLPYTGVSAVPS